ncbi:orc1/cdc6 family replication initiation protein [Halogranum rubrum]|uniref:ORC1-type DNA replication protein n=1 Tax=Halogranum salarium B-1 TaxID=1210908 RepID=J3JDB4_9EURY|nr:orc1/cdc6 family replication initiation protein [Halogranum salarium]EJN57344.1 Orc1-type DNA replication protein [Halogranum salarium B-1]
MNEISFTPDDSLYQDRDSLSEDYTPNSIVGRDSEIQQYHTALQPVINGEQPNNIFLYGKTGVGKTAVTNYLLNQLRQDASQFDVDLSVVSLNCEGLNSSYQIAINLVNRLRPPEAQISKTGHPQYEIYEFLWNNLDEIGGTVLIVLDEVDNIGDDDSILYQIPRARSNGNIENARVGIIGISNDLAFRENLSPKVRSSLCEKSISFPPYDADELQAVLSQRAAVAFHEGALDNGVLELCAAYGAQDAGDARKALDLLRGAGDIARAENAAEVTADHVKRARAELEREELMDGIADLADHQQLVLYALATLQAEGETPARSQVVYQRYEELCELAALDSRTSRRVRDFLADLAMLSIIVSSQRNDGLAGGQYRDHKLKHDLETVLSAMSDLLERIGIHHSIHDVVAKSDVVMLSTNLESPSE